MPAQQHFSLTRENQLRTLRSEVYECLTANILPFWLNRMRDAAGGGWYGRMTGAGALVKDAPRGAVLYARLLWTMSAAYRVVGGGELLEAATATKDYILAHFVDREWGGTFWSVAADGAPMDTRKQFYAQAFMLYGFSEYARATSATGDASLRRHRREAQDMAQHLFDIIERHARDGVHGGYVEACTRDWQPIADMRLSAKDANCPKSQNTHLHIIEAYASWRAGAVRELIDLFCERILNPATHHLDLFFDMDWRRMSTTESYGHDIECSWLLHEAALALGDEAILNRVEPVVRAVAAASEKGLQADGSMIYEGEPDGSHADYERHWWVQAEAVVGFFNLYQHFGDEAALDKALRAWDYIKGHLIDHDLGEWFWSVRDDGSVNRDDDRVGFWKCPYHNGRMCLELITRIDAMLDI